MFANIDTSSITAALCSTGSSISPDSVIDGSSVRTEEIPDGGSAGTVSLTGVLGDIVSSSTGDAGNSDELDDFNVNLNFLHISLDSIVWKSELTDQVCHQLRA